MNTDVTNEASKMSLQEFTEKYSAFAKDDAELKKIYHDLRKKAEQSKTDDDHVAGNKRVTFRVTASHKLQPTKPFPLSVVKDDNGK